MDKIEVSGRTIEEAVEIAARELGVSIDAVEYEIVEEGSKGFLGLGQIPAMIKAGVKEGVEPGEPPAPVKEPEQHAEEAQDQDELEAALRRESQAAQAAGGTAFTDAVLTIVADVVTAMGLDAKPVLKEDTEEEVLVEIVGKDLGMLIGKRGQTLDALQYIVGIGANKHGGDGKKRVILDAEGYRERHKQTLIQTALEYAKAVKEQGQEAVLEPQPARDRRIVHMALAEDPDVYTYSEGMGDDRHVVISPKK